MVENLDLDQLFELLILARNSKDEEALQEAIDLVAVASSSVTPPLSREEIDAIWRLPWVSIRRSADRNR
jgi:hypothetical protein